MQNTDTGNYKFRLTCSSVQFRNNVGDFQCTSSDLVPVGCSPAILCILNGYQVATERNTHTYDIIYIHFSDVMVTVVKSSLS